MEKKTKFSSTLQKNITRRFEVYGDIKNHDEKNCRKYILLSTT